MNQTRVALVDVVNLTPPQTQHVAGVMPVMDNFSNEAEPQANHAPHVTFNTPTPPRRQRRQQDPSEYNAAESKQSLRMHNLQTKYLDDR